MVMIFCINAECSVKCSRSKLKIRSTEICWSGRESKLMIVTEYGAFNSHFGLFIKGLIKPQNNSHQFSG